MVLVPEFHSKTGCVYLKQLWAPGFAQRLSGVLGYQYVNQTPSGQNADMWVLSWKSFWLGWAPLERALSILTGEQNWKLYLDPDLKTSLLSVWQDLGSPVRDCLEHIKWCGKPHLNCGWNHSLGRVPWSEWNGENELSNGSKHASLLSSDCGRLLLAPAALISPPGWTVSWAKIKPLLHWVVLSE